jgi:hypothetical protein
MDINYMNKESSCHETEHVKINVWDFIMKKKDALTHAHAER